MADRDEIAILRSKGYSFADIGVVMGRAGSGIWKEIKIGSVRDVYDPKKAQHKAYVRRKYAKFQGKKIVDHNDLRKEIVWRLKDGQRPDAIARRITHREKHLPPISKNAIYAWLKSSYGAPITRWLQKQKRRHKRRHEKLSGRTFIDRRPRYIDQRKRVGDIEFDFIVSGKSGSGVLLTVVDRKLRIPFIEKILPVSIKNFEAAFLHIKQRFPEMKTGTTDNDILFKDHERLAGLLGIRIFFCHPYHSWEKGLIEHMNRLIRRSIPKGSDISNYSKAFVRHVELKLQRRPMACLRDRTPEEMLARYRKRNKNGPRGVIHFGAGR